MQAITRSDLARLARLEGASRRPAIDPAERERFDWYADSCPCKLAPGECREHPRARPAQRPPGGDWRVWAYTGGRGTGKSRAAVGWMYDRINRGVCRHGLAIGATAQDIRDVLVEGPSGFLGVCPPWDLPRYEPSKRRLTWRNGARVTLLSGEEPDRSRGLNVDTLLCDELPHWARARESYDLAMLALRAGADPRCMISTTPRRAEVLIRILGEPSTVTTREATIANARHLAPEFVNQIVAMYQGTRFAQSEIEGNLPELSEGVWFGTFSESVHVQPIAILAGLPVYVAIDAGTSRWTAACFFQCQRVDRYRIRFLIHDDYLAVDMVSADNAEAIKAQFTARFPDVEPEAVFIDGASSARTSIGPAALSEYQRVFSERKVMPIWRRSVADSLDQLEAALQRGDLVLHGRCEDLTAGFKNFARHKVSGEYQDIPAPLQHPAGDMIDSLAYGVLGICGPEGRKPPRIFAATVHESRLF